MLVVDAGARPAISTILLGRPHTPATGRREDLIRKSPTISPDNLRVNRQIRVPQVMLIDDTGKSLGVLTTDEALRLAQERGFDLVEVAPNAKPPVCRFLDYGAFQYRVEKQERKAKANAKRVEVKGVRLSFKIGEHDWQVRQQTARRFLDEGHRVKIEMILRGRENAHQDRARESVKKFIEGLGDKIYVDQPLNKQGNKLFCVIGEKK